MLMLLMRAIDMPLGNDLWPFLVVVLCEMVEIVRLWWAIFTSLWCGLNANLETAH